MIDANFTIKCILQEIRDVIGVSWMVSWWGGGYLIDKSMYCI